MAGEIIPESRATSVGISNLLECRSLVASIQDFGTFETHEAFVSRLRVKHGRKTGFWSQISETCGAQG